MEVDEAESPRSIALATEDAPSPPQFLKILGVRFFNGDVHQAIALMKHGGLLVAPAAPGLNKLPNDEPYREAISSADVAITDSGIMVLVWNFLHRNKIRRVSGLEYFRELIREPELREPELRQSKFGGTGGTFWVMASDTSAATNRKWLLKRGIPITKSDIYVAPYYSGAITDPVLLRIIEERRPANIIVTIGGGKQERLGLYLKRNLGYRPAIHCIGAAIGFLSGDQVRIPMWADHLRIGWLFRCISDPRRYLPRYWRARGLPALIIKYRSQLPLDR